MLVIADTSALLALASCDSLILLDSLFEVVRVPHAVFDECTVPGKPRAGQLEIYLQDKVAEVSLTDLVIAAAGLGEGELEAMALYKRLHADRLLVDDSSTSWKSPTQWVAPVHPGGHWAMVRYWFETFTFNADDHSVVGITQPRGIFCHHVQYRLNISR